MNAEALAEWRERQSAAFALEENSSAKRAVTFPLWGASMTAYANANLSVISPQECNAACPFCVEKLRHSSAGREFARTGRIPLEKYLTALDNTLAALAPLNPSVSVTGGEPTLDPALPSILAVLRRRRARKLTVTTNGSGLLSQVDGRSVLEWIAAAGARHLNVSRASVDAARNTALMRMRDGLNREDLGRALRLARDMGVRPRLSCVLVKGEVDRPEKILEYLDFAESMGVDNVVFRELMKPDEAALVPGDPVAGYCRAFAVPLTPVLDWVSGDQEFSFIRQVMGYYYYVEVWRRRGIDVVFEAADLARAETARKKRPGLAYELVFHPDGALATTWRPWDGALNPPNGGSGEQIETGRTQGTGLSPQTNETRTPEASAGNG